MKTTRILTGLISGALILAACNGKDDPAVTQSTTSPTGVSMTNSSMSDSDSDSGTSGDPTGNPTTDPTTGPTTDPTTGPTTDPTTGDPTTDPTTDPTMGTSTGGCTFIDCDDGGDGPDTQCDIWAQDCPEGEKCMPWANDGGSSWNATKCTPVDANPNQPGDVCSAPNGGVSGEDDCVKSAMCWNTDPETNEGTCVGFCEGNAESYSCQPGFSCLVANDGVLILCLEGCDPLLQDCPGGDLCLPSDGKFICVLDASGEAGAYGDPCEYANACDPGNICLNTEYVPDCMAAGCCSPFCDTSEDPANCPTGTECIPWYEEGMEEPGYETVGICGIPQ